MLDIRNPLAPVIVGKGLFITVYAGNLLLAGVPNNIQQTTIAVSPSSTNYVFISSLGVVSVNTTGFPVTGLPIAIVTTDQNSVSGYQDSRPDFILVAGSPTGTVTAPGNLTINKIPKASAATVLVDSSVTDNGIIVSTTEPIAVPDGGVNSASVQFNTEPSLGLFHLGAGQLGITSAGIIGWFDANGWHGFGTKVEVFNDTATSTDGLIVETNGNATVGVQKISPRLRLTGSGWKTNAVAGPEAVDWIIENLPVQGAADPSTNLNISSQINAGGYVQQASLTSVGEWDIGPQDTVNNGVLGLRGKTSGKAMFTAPAVAGTATNPIVSSNSISVPTGNGITSAGTTTIIGGNQTLSVVNGSGTQVSFLTILNVISSYKSIATVDNGVPSEIGHLDLTAQAGAITATTIYTPTATGRYRISVYEKVTTVDGAASVLGGATGTVVTFTDGTDSVAQSITMALDNQAGTVQLFNNGNTTTTSLNGFCYIYAKTGVPIQIAVGYTSTTPGQMIFAVRATCEAM